jgi:DnaJ-class molecular chaperone
MNLGMPLVPRARNLPALTQPTKKEEGGMATQVCPRCDGSNIITEPCPVYSELSDVRVADCPVCAGDGWIESQCPQCGGTGQVEDQIELELEIANSH